MIIILGKTAALFSVIDPRTQFVSFYSFAAEISNDSMANFISVLFKAKF